MLLPECRIMMHLPPCRIFLWGWGLVLQLWNILNLNIIQHYVLMSKSNLSSDGPLLVVTGS